MKKISLLALVFAASASYATTEKVVSIKDFETNHSFFQDTTVNPNKKGNKTRSTNDMKPRDTTRTPINSPGTAPMNPAIPDPKYPVPNDPTKTIRPGTNTTDPTRPVNSPNPDAIPNPLQTQPVPPTPVPTPSNPNPPSSSPTSIQPGTSPTVTPPTTTPPSTIPAP